MMLLPIALPAIALSASAVPPAGVLQEPVPVPVAATVARQVAGRGSRPPLPPAPPEHRGWSYPVLVRYVIEPDGRVNLCGESRSRIPSPHPLGAACAFVRAEFRFEPARNAAGEAVAQVRHEWLTWPEPTRSAGAIPLSPQESSPPPELQAYLARRGARQARLRRGSFDYQQLPGVRLEHQVPEGRVEIALDVNAAGVVRSCSILRSSGIKLLDDGTCNVALWRTFFYPAQDASGRPAASVVTLTIHWIEDFPHAPPPGEAPPVPAP